MPIPPPKKKSLPPAKYKRAEPIQNGLRYQPNQDFESEEEIKTWIRLSYPKKDVKIIKVWKVTVVRCQIEVPQL